MIGWEYRMVLDDDCLPISEMNTLGRDGWELVGVLKVERRVGGLRSITQDCYRYIFKRPMESAQ